MALASSGDVLLHSEPLEEDPDPVESKHAEEQVMVEALVMDQNASTATYWGGGGSGFLQV